METDANPCLTIICHASTVIRPVSALTPGGPSRTFMKGPRSHCNLEGKEQCLVDERQLRAAPKILRPSVRCFSDMFIPAHSRSKSPRLSHDYDYQVP
ncbi:unnamed protein product, partial [Mycena citricolor]